MSAEGSQIREARRARGMTQKALSAATGVGLRSITRIETGESAAEGKDDGDRPSVIRLQRYLQIGPFAPRAAADKPNDPPLSEATFVELVAALVARHSQDVRAALDVETYVRLSASDGALRLRRQVGAHSTRVHS